MNHPPRSIHDLVYGRQYNRILRLSFPDNDAPPSQFVVSKIDATESLSRDFEFTVELLSDEADVALKEMQGKLLIPHTSQKCSPTTPPIPATPPHPPDPASAYRPPS
jgi:hypothetical protein